MPSTKRERIPRGRVGVVSGVIILGSRIPLPLAGRG